MFILRRVLISPGKFLNSTGTGARESEDMIENSRRLKRDFDEEGPVAPT